MSLRGASILIWGGTGFLGSHLVRRLTELGARVHLAARASSSLARLAGIDPVPTCTRVELDDASGLQACIRQVRPDFVFLTAATTSDRGRSGPAHDAWLSSYDINVLGTLRLLRAIAVEAPDACVIRTGSLAEYGVAPVPFHEDAKEQPVSAYATSLNAATQLAQAQFRETGLRVTTARLALTYGPGQSVSFLIPSLITACLEGRPFALRSPGHSRDFMYVDDAVGALVALTAQPGLAGEVINIGSGREVRVGDVATMIVRLCGGRLELRPDKTAAGTADVKRLVLDVSRARERLGWHVQVGLDEGLARTIAWYRMQTPA